MATLLSLANEILLQIIDETRPDSIWSFLRCCKRIWTVGAQDLEQHRQDVGRYGAPSFWFWADHSEYDLGTYDFLAELLLQPRRALYVKSISVLNRGFQMRQIRTEMFPKKMRLQFDQVCGLFFGGAGCPYIQKGGEICEWVRKLHRGDTNAVICLITTLLPNLTRLTINEYDDQGYAELIYMVSKANRSAHCIVPAPLSLNKLSTITINDTRSMDRPGQTLGIFETCMTLPSLRSLKGKYIDCEFNRWPPEEELLMASNVTEINFDRSAISAEAFTRLLTNTRNLQHFTYKFVRLLGISGDYTAMSLKGILEQHTAHTLTHLDLDFNGRISDESGRYIGSLRQMQSLQHLRIQANMFVDCGNSQGGQTQLVDLLPLLPASIETLTLLSQGQDPFVTYTLDKLREKRGDLPNFRNFTCEKAISITDGLVDECASLGIDMVYA